MVRTGSSHASSLGRPGRQRNGSRSERSARARRLFCDRSALVGNEVLHCHFPASARWGRLATNHHLIRPSMWRKLAGRWRVITTCLVVLSLPAVYLLFLRPALPQLNNITAMRAKYFDSSQGRKHDFLVPREHYAAILDSLQPSQADFFPA